MTFTELLILLFVLGFIFSGIWLIKQTAKKMKLTDEQLKQIKLREEAQKQKDKQLD